MRRIAAAGLVAGMLIAWIDTRPGWDDTGVTAGAIVTVAALVAFLGLRWWASAGLVVAPLMAAEFRSSGALLLAPAFALLGAIGGTLVRGLTRPNRM